MSGLDFPEITPVREAHRFDEGRLIAYLNRELEGDFSDLTVNQFEGGQSNPTYLLESQGVKYVMRKKPPGQLLKSAHQVDREYRVMKALEHTDVPVPKMYALCEDDSVLGQAFYIMSHAEGRVMMDPMLPNVPKEERKPLYENFIGVLATLHAVDYHAVGLSDFGREGNYYARQISRWSKQYELSKVEEIPEMDALMKWLPENVPEFDESTIAHGDYRIGNCIVHPTEPRVVAVLDWELCTIGHPFGDLGYNAMMYHQNTGVDWEGECLPTEQDLLDWYCEASGRPPIENWSFYVIYNLFRIGAIVQGVYKRGLDGNASSEKWKERKDSCRDSARIAWKLVEETQ
jgi:aminoglycoside phosphotransferase (APT) family kinase protein